MRYRWLLWVVPGILLAGCFGGRYVSADGDLEALYVGQSYYEVVDEFGRPDATMQDALEGTKIAYNSVSLNGTKAEELYRRHKVRNRVTGREGVPSGGITFSFDAKMRCYAVDSDFQRERTKEDRAAKAKTKDDPRRPMKVKPKVPRTLEDPYFSGKSPFAAQVTLLKVEVERDATKVYFMYRARTPERVPVTGDGLYVMPDTFLEDRATGHRFAMTAHTGITLYPERTRFARNQGGYDVLYYTLTFEPIDTDTEYIDIVEPGHSGYNFYGVDVRTPYTTKEELKH